MQEKLNPDLTTADLALEGLRLYYCDFNFDNFLLEDLSNLNSLLTVIDFEYTTELFFSFLV